MIVAGILTPLENALAWLLEHLHNSVGFSWGWSIIALTVIVRVALVPLMVRQIHSMQSMQKHMPEMKAIQTKYKGDRTRLNEELMKFYKENNINPAASCLPLLFQFPIFIALYFVLRNFTKHVNAAPEQLGWLIVPNITAKITAHWSGYVLLVVYVVSQVASGLLRVGLGPAQPADHADGAAGLLRPGDHALPGRPAHVLDDDEPVDGRAGDRHEADGPEAGPAAEALVPDAAEGRAGAASPRWRPSPAPFRRGPAPPRRVKRKKKRGGR